MRFKELTDLQLVDELRKAEHDFKIYKTILFSIVITVLYYIWTPAFIVFWVIFALWVMVTVMSLSNRGETPTKAKLLNDEILRRRKEVKK